MQSAVGQWRGRVSLTSTVKEGFRVGEAALEFTETVSVDGERNREEFKRRLKELIEDGQDVATQMNRQNDLAKTTNVTAPVNHQEK